MVVRRGSLVLLKASDHYILAAVSPGHRILLFVGREQEMEEHLAGFRSAMRPELGQAQRSKRSNPYGLHVL